jgi:diaminopropionate ammonia-lyase
MSSNFSRHRARLFHNPRALPEREYDRTLREVLSRDAFSLARAEIASWPGYRPTPLIGLHELAKSAGLKRIWYKDEGGRFGLGSFKALGGAYAVYRLLAREIGRRQGTTISAAELLAGKHRDTVAAVTVTCATDGNHGRSVAWGAQMFGCRCVIYIHETVSEGRAKAIARYGAEVVRTPGTYDDAVRRAAEDAARNGWFVVSDTSYEGYMDVPRDVMQGYTVMVDEALGQLPEGESLTHVFVQGGVGGLAAAVCGHLWETLGAARPRFIVVEPEKADCLYRSAVTGRPTPAEGSLDTIMAGLACGEVSLLAWRILEAGADDFMTVSDEAAADCMRLLASPLNGDPPIVAGESAVAGLAGLLIAANHADQRAALGLGAESRVLLIGSEGDTDPELYARIVGRPATEIRGR